MIDWGHRRAVAAGQAVREVMAERSWWRVASSAIEFARGYRRRALGEREVRLPPLCWTPACTRIRIPKRGHFFAAAAASLSCATCSKSWSRNGGISGNPVIAVKYGSN